MPRCVNEWARGDARSRMVSNHYSQIDTPQVPPNP